MPNTTNLNVEGMSCDGCERNVVTALEAVPGVENAVANHEQGIATVEGDADADLLVSAVENAGYDASA